MADQAKANGNAAFSSGKFDEAVKHFTDAIALAPENHVLYSNRSAAYASLHKYVEALEDAQKTVELQPSWAKGFSRLGAAHMGLGEYDDAIAAYKKGLNIDPTNTALKDGLADATKAKEKDEKGGGMGPFGNAFSDPDIWAKLHNDPRTRAFLLQPDFRGMITDIQKNPSKLSTYLNDPRMMQALGVVLGINIQTASSAKDAASMFGEDEEEEGVKKREEDSAPSFATKQKDEPVSMEEDKTEEDEEEKDKKAKKEAALKEKEEGNAAYKKKDFEKAIQHYTNAIELDDSDVSFITNRAAVYLEMGNYEECIKDCDRAVERGREVHADYKMIARALTRKGAAFVKMAKSSADLDPAISAFNKALTEHRNPDTLKKLNDAEKMKRELEQKEYYNPQLAEEEREKGNEQFKKMLYPEAVRFYTEAIKRNPQDVKAYSNRSASYTKLGALPEALKDAEKCIELEPQFVKGYLRKGAAQYFMKEYDKALSTYQEGLKIEPANHELLDGVRSCVQQISKTNRGDLSPEELKERQAKAMQDPEIQAILTDPIMRQVLIDFQENPKSAAEHQKNPMVMAKIQKLVSSGIVQMR